ncbi:LOW QUALITY PROTEIN: interleukin-6 receptor subunit alpha [Falco biarmicus]|uniref:LOW QUALITY PROTEIN: interleukin-6 receptor subunit alpha n=1 Tax=Falco biarmicus TaxID=345155 RepID=UPI0024BCA2FC|nr:LOW QUALITY PROTEIN: interleukin-6 receptor subunit alpha [Falco biarmicus]
MGLSRDTVLGRPGANVTLTCQDQAPVNVPVSWQVEARGASAAGGRRLAGGNVLLLQRLRYEDSGRYSCSLGGRPLRSLRLLVEEPPETPRVSCYRRSHDKDVLCEWPLQAKPSPGTRAMLWVKRRFVAENATEQRCRYFSKARKFLCRVKVPPGTEDTKPLVVSTCAHNGAGASAGEDRIITLSSVLKPDPPLNVTVEALEKAPQRLRVNWSYPSSWDPRFYWLRFQVRYRPEPARTFTEVRPLPQVDQVMTTWLDIRDAWRGMQHVVQVRAQEEFGHGAWSEWSREAVGTPLDSLTESPPFTLQTPATSPLKWDPSARRWDVASAPGGGGGGERDMLPSWVSCPGVGQGDSKVAPVPPHPPTSSCSSPGEDGTYGITLPPELFGEDDAGGEEGARVGSSTRSVAHPSAFLVAGGSLLLGIALFVGIVVRYKQMWRTGGWRTAKPEGEGQHVLVPLGPPSPPLSDTPLLSPPAPPVPGALHVTNLDYFFSGQ